jgi:hypothetical protein
MRQAQLRLALNVGGLAISVPLVFHGPIQAAGISAHSVMLVFGSEYITSSKPQLPIQTAVLDGFGDMFWLNARLLG